MVRTPKFEGQLERKDGTFDIFGAWTIKECINLARHYLDERYTGRLMVWGNSKAGQTYFERQGKINCEIQIN